MSAVFVYADKASLAVELVGIGKAAGAQTYALAFTDEEASALVGCGADGIVVVENATRPLEYSAPGLAQLLKERDACALLVGASPQGRDLAAQTAAYLDCAMSSDVISVELGEHAASIQRTMYGGTIVESADLDYPAVITVGAGVGNPVAGDAPVERVPIAFDNRVQLVEEEAVKKGGVDLHSAKVIVSIGKGVRELADMAMIEELADALGAAIGCSRCIAEERHWLPPEQYVGLSGEDVAPDLYLAVGLSGQAQHVAGARGAKIIAAVNSDANAPIFRAADYGIIGDLYLVVPGLIEAVKSL